MTLVGESYFSAEIQLAYSTAPANKSEVWARARVYVWIHPQLYESVLLSASVSVCVCIYVDAAVCECVYI